MSEVNKGVEAVAYWKIMQDSVSAGNLRLDPDTAGKAIRIINKHIDELEGFIRQADELKPQHGFGDLESAEHVRNKVCDQAEKVKDILRQQIDVDIHMREMFRRAGQAYAQAEAESRARLKGLGE